MLKTLTISELQPGMLVSKVVSQHGPVKLRKIGMIRSPEMIKGLTEMGVTEVEVDLSQSVGIEDDSANTAHASLSDSNTGQENVKLTPTQQLLQNERQSAKVNGPAVQQFNRSLFMPSSDALPSIWQLYGKNAALLSLLIVGGLCVGWNIASVPYWLSLSKSKDYVVIDYQPLTKMTAKKEQSETALNEIGSSEAEATVIANAAPVQELPVADEPLVLGYQPDDSSSARDAQVTSITEDESEPALSAELLEKINKAIEELDNEPSSDTRPQTNSNYDDLPRIDQLSVAIQTQIPSMAFSAHMYSSNRDGRWVRVNGRRLVEGDYIAQGLQLVNIEPQTVILSFKDEVFTMNALTDW